ncbi:unnamed protein product (macronuclear) [Paramecium tetraurelia]|uniref:Uncharacterized protein n=1 Tax=Paramecium tetraurelia TaxID=5888 RepID=A0C197_PARTE|nr:uncharacterized protein GSPATT00034040001 [Paramecium tetraurelia]CAK64564.1 unnamed protein product [Paramecium tetraurelia]|eukprot:XP_001431962.1 hypothetical protein (macronuclear) [Paramecium tetraurelia strain d4-2]
MIFYLLQQITGAKVGNNLSSQSSSNSQLLMKCLGTNEIHERILEMKFDKVRYLNKQHPSPSLRGGGCGGSKKKSQMSITIPINYQSTMKQNCQILIDKCDQISDGFSRNELMMSIQWFSDNRYWICEICKNDNLILMLYDVALNSFRQLISVIPVYLRGSGCLCYYVLEVCNDLLLIIYTYQLNDDSRYLTVEMHGDLLTEIDIIKNDLEIHKNFWIRGLEFQITLIKIVLINSKTNSKEQQDKLISIASSAFSSILSLSISEDFTNALFDFAKYLLIEKFNQYSFPIQTYQIYYFFFLLKWNIIKNIQEKNELNKQIESLQRGYEQYVQNSDNWIVHFCWINAISDLIAYRQIISKSVFLNSLQPKQLWNDLIKQNIIKVLSYDKLLGKVNNDFSFKSIDYESEQTLINLGVKKIKSFQNAILNQQFYNKQNFFQFYVNFTFQKQKKPQEKTTISQQLELLGADEQMKRLNRLSLLLKEIKEKITIQYSESLGKSFQTTPQEKETKNNVNKYDLILDKDGEVQQLDFTLLKLSYLLNEVNFTMIIEKKRMEICQESAKMNEYQNEQEKQNQNKKEKNKLLSQIDDQQKQLEKIYDDWLKIDLPKKYNQIFDLIANNSESLPKLSKGEKIKSQEKQMQSQENELNFNRKIFIRTEYLTIIIQEFLETQLVISKIIQ